jgi:hypothetical protein
MAADQQLLRGSTLQVETLARVGRFRGFQIEIRRLAGRPALVRATARLRFHSFAASGVGVSARARR